MKEFRLRNGKVIMVSEAELAALKKPAPDRTPKEKLACLRVELRVREHGGDRKG